MKNISVKILISIFWTILALLISCSSDNNPVDNDDVSNTNYKAEETETFKMAVSNHILLKLEAINGNISITGLQDYDSIIAVCEKYVRSESMEDAEEHLQKLEVNLQDSGSEIYFKTIQPDESHDRNYVVHYDIKIPDNIEIIVVDLNGIVQVDSVHQNVSVENANGQIILNGISGSVLGTIINGYIESTVILPTDGSLILSAINGGIGLNIPQITSATFSASVTLGSISISNLDLQNEVKTNNTLTGTLNNGQGSISLSTINGNIAVIGI
jgi:hypothetical protein